MAGNTGPNIATDGLVLYLDAANTKSYVSGSTAYANLSENINIIRTATLSNQNSTITLPQYSSENLGVFNFNGTGSVISVATDPSTSGFWPINQFSLETWFKSPGLGLNQTIGGIFGFTYGIRCFIDSSPAGAIRFTVNSSSTSSRVISDTSKNYFDNQ